MSMKKRTVAEWQTELDGVLLSIRDQFLKLGEIMHYAYEELAGPEYAELMAYIRKWGLKDADVRAAKAAFLFQHPELGKNEKGQDKQGVERVAPELLFAGAKNSKILNMDKEDQQRLLSKEKFDVVMSNGKVDPTPKSWDELTDVQRNVLVGKGGEIQTVDKQIAAMNGTPKNLGMYPLGSVELTKSGVIFTSRDGKWHLRVSLPDYAKMLLREKGLWDALKEAVDDAEQEEGKPAYGNRSKEVQTARRLATR